MAFYAAKGEVFPAEELLVLCARGITFGLGLDVSSHCGSFGGRQLVGAFYNPLGGPRATHRQLILFIAQGRCGGKLHADQSVAQGEHHCGSISTERGGRQVRRRMSVIP